MSDGIAAQQTDTAVAAVPPTGSDSIGKAEAAEGATGSKGKARRNNNADPRVANRQRDPRSVQSNDPRKQRARRKVDTRQVKPAAVVDQGSSGEQSRPGRPRPEVPEGISKRSFDRQIGLSFEPYVSHPYTVCKTPLESEFSKRLFMDYVGRAQVSLYNLVVLLPIRIKMHQARVQDYDRFVEGIEDMIDARIQALVDEISKATERNRVLYKTHNCEVKVDYTNPETKVLKVYTPQTRRLLGLLTVYDEYIRSIEEIWHGDVLNGKMRRDAISKYRGEIVRFVRLLMHLYRESDRRLKDNAHAGELSFIEILQAQVPDEAMPDSLSDEDEDHARNLIAEAAPSPEVAMGS